MAKESLLDRLRSKPTDVLDEEGKLRKELLDLKLNMHQDNSKKLIKLER